MIGQGVHAVFVHTKDLKRSAEWYSWLLGLPFSEKDVESPVYNLPVKEGVYLTIDDHAFDSNYTFEPLSAPAFNFCSDHLKESYQRMKDHNVPITRKIETNGDFGWFHIQDPDGNALMICGTVKP
ncbi:VOC family protein [Halobacillus fulvus]|nr:VOC family protein [Halobacillus fulvus]